MCGESEKFLMHMTLLLGVGVSEMGWEQDVELSALALPLSLSALLPPFYFHPFLSLLFLSPSFCLGSDSSDYDISCSCSVVFSDLCFTENRDLVRHLNQPLHFFCVCHDFGLCVSVRVYVVSCLPLSPPLLPPILQMPPSFFSSAFWSLRFHRLLLSRFHPFPYNKHHAVTFLSVTGGWDTHGGPPGGGTAPPPR